MDTSDRQIAETGRNRELGLIPAMVMAVVATLSGAGVSFAPLYERIWGGMDVASELSGDWQNDLLSLGPSN